MYELYVSKINASHLQIDCGISFWRNFPVLYKLHCYGLKRYGYCTCVYTQYKLSFCIMYGLTIVENGRINHDEMLYVYSVFHIPGRVKALQITKLTSLSLRLPFQLRSYLCLCHLFRLDSQQTRNYN